MLSVQKACVEDSEEMLKVKINAFQEDVARYGFGPPWYDSLERLIAHIQQGNYFKVLWEDSIIGGAGVVDGGDGHYRIGGIYIDPAYQNKGIGGQVMKFIEGAFPHALAWSLDTPSLSYRNHHFYEKLGFIKTGETAPDQKGFSLFLYEKQCFPS